MHHDTTLSSTVPVLGASLANDHVPRVNLPWLSTLVTDPAAAHLHFENLTSLVSVPVCTGAWGEEDMVEHYLVGIGVRARTS